MMRIFSLKSGEWGKQFVYFACELGYGIHKITFLAVKLIYYETVLNIQRITAIMRAVSMYNDVMLLHGYSFSCH